MGPTDCGDPALGRTRKKLLLLLLGPERNRAGKGRDVGGRGFGSRFQFTWKWWCERTLESRGTRRCLVFSSS